MKTSGLSKTWGPGVFAQVNQDGADSLRLEQSRPSRMRDVIDGLSKTVIVAESAGRPLFGETEQSLALSRSTKPMAVAGRAPPVISRSKESAQAEPPYQFAA